MLLRRIHHDQLAQSSYLAACQASREAVIVDPLRDPAPYLEAARLAGVRIAYVIETHVHADFVSGACALAAAAGATLVLSGAGSDDASYDRDAYPRARWVRDGDVLRVGAVRLDVLHVPGHTPEHIAFVVTDEATSVEPVGLLSGDFLFVGDVGRPDLLERSVGTIGTMERSARQLFSSLQRLRAFPDFLQVWPGHGAGSACGKALGAVPQSTLGYERRANWAFAQRDEDAFVEQVLAGQPEPPAYFKRMKRLNATGGLHDAIDAAPHSDASARAALGEGAQVVDTRSPRDFGAGHLARAVNIPLGASFLTWCGSVLDPDRAVVLLASPSERSTVEAAGRSLRTIGFDRVIGTIAANDTASLGPLVRLSTVPAASLGAGTDAGTVVLDVRNQSEWDEGHLPDARHIPLAQLVGRVDEIPRGARLLVHCQGGSRSAVAASVLSAAGFADVANVEGGYAEWLRAGNVPVTGD